MLNLDNNLMLAVSHGRFASQSSLRRRSALTCCGTTGERACPHLTPAICVAVSFRTVLHHMRSGIHGCVAPKLSQRALARRAVDKGITSRNVQCSMLKWVLLLLDVVLTICLFLGQSFGSQPHPIPFQSFRLRCEY